MSDSAASSSTAALLGRGEEWLPAAVPAKACVEIPQLIFGKCQANPPISRVISGVSCTRTFSPLKPSHDLTHAEMPTHTAASPIPAPGQPKRKRSGVLQSSLDLVFSCKRRLQRG